MLTRWSPFTLATLPSPFDSRTRGAWLVRAPMDVRRTADGFHLETPLAGFKPEDVEITLDRGTLTIRARRSEETNTEQGQYVRREVYRGGFVRRVALPAEVKAEDVSASFENGLLTVDVKSAPADQAVRIPVGQARQPEVADAEPATAQPETATEATTETAGA